MSHNLEIESKALIDEIAYSNLTLNLSSYVQINYYIDTPDFKVSKSKLGLRIRQKEDNYELTIKIKQEVGKLEINQDISKEDFLNLKDKYIFPDGEVKDSLVENNIPIVELKIFTTLVTTRTDIKYKKALISIDKSEYNGITDYEIECEASSKKDAKKYLKKFLKENGIPYVRNPVSKLKRAMNSL